MSVRTTHLKLIGAAGAAALTVGALASPALAAGSTASATYTCTTPLGDAHPSAVYDVAAAPTKMAVGQPLKTTATFTLDAATTGLATQGLGWSSFNGTIKTAPSAAQAGLNLKIAKTTLGALGQPTNATAKGSTLAGTKTGGFTFKLGDLGDVVLNGYDASGNKVGSVEFPTAGSFGRCTNDAGTTTLMSGATPVTTKIVKDTTTTKDKVAYSAKTKKAKSSAKVRSHFGTAVKGKVKFTLKKGTKKVNALTAKVNKKGVAKVVFKGVKAKGKYTVTAKYLGSKTLKSSHGTAHFRVR